MSIEAMKQALEALEKMVTPRNFQTHQFCQKAYDDLRQAIAEAEKQEPVAWMVDVDLANYQGQSEYRTILAWNAKPVWSGTHEINEVLKAIPLYTTPPAQEFVCSTGLCHFTLTQTNVGIGERGMQAYEAAKKRGWLGVSDERLMEMPEQSPAAQRQWVGLTDEEINELWNWVYYAHNEAPQTPFSFGKAIEAKLKEKNT